MEKYIPLLIFVVVGFILFATIRSVLLLFWEVQKKRKTWLWSYLDYLKFYFEFKTRWLIFGVNSMPEQNAKILYWNFTDPKGPSYNHKFARKAGKVVKSYIECFYT